MLFWHDYCFDCLFVKFGMCNYHKYRQICNLVQPNFFAFEFESNCNFRIEIKASLYNKTNDFLYVEGLASLLHCVFQRHCESFCKTALPNFL